MPLFGMGIIGTFLTALVWFDLDHRPAQSVSIGSPAPTFALADQNGRTHHLADYKGRPVILAFYPQQTPAATAELASLKEQVHAFDGAGAKIFAISGVPQQEQKTLHDRERLPFPLLFDPMGRVAAQYGALDHDHHIKNSVFVVDATGRLVLTIPQQDIQPGELGKQILKAAQCCFVPMPTSVAGAIGATIADFSLPRADTGAMETLYGDHTAKATVVFFISAKCPCSQGYDARMKALAERYAARQVRFLGINSSADETSAEAAAHQMRVGLPFPVLRDAGNVVADQMKARVTPEAFLLDAQEALRYHGRIDDDRTGEHIKSNDLANALDSVLAGKQPAITYQAGLGCAIFRKEH